MKNISFALTTDQIRRRAKTVTRRVGWNNLKPGQLLCAVVKGMGLKPGEKIERLAIIRVTDVRDEWLVDITADDCAREGFPGMTPDEFVRMFRDAMGLNHTYLTVRRIEFSYVPGGRF